MTHSSPTRSSSHRELPGPTPDEAEAGILPFVVRICTCETQRAVFAECQHARLQLHGIAQGGDHSRADRPAVTTCPQARRTDRKSTRMNSSHYCEYRIPAHAQKKKNNTKDHI